MRLFDGFGKKPDTPIKKLYLLVHPFYDLCDRMQIGQFREIWMDSVSDAAKDGYTFAITFFSGLPFELDEPDRFKFCLDKPSELELQIGKHVLQSFGKSRSRFIMAKDLSIKGLTYHQDIGSRIDNPKELIITARGVYADRCVDDARRAAIEAYKVPEENAHIVYQESIFGDRRTAQEHRFPEHIRKPGLG